MKHFFIQTDGPSVECYNVEGTALNDEIDDALRPILKRVAEEGYSVKEAVLIAHDVLSFIDAYVRTVRNLEVKRREIQ